MSLSVSGATVAPCSSAASKTPSHEMGSVDARAASMNRIAPPASSMFVPTGTGSAWGGGVTRATAVSSARATVRAWAK